VTMSEACIAAARIKIFLIVEMARAVFVAAVALFDGVERTPFPPWHGEQPNFSSG